MGKKFELNLFMLLLLLSNIIHAQVPVIIKQPINQGVIEGQTATFFIEALGDSLTYQWFLNDTLLIPGATDSTYTTPALTIAANKSKFKCIVTNPEGTDTSDTATLYITALGSRVKEGLQLLYNFKEGSSNILNDSSGSGTPYNLTIDNTTAVTWTPYGLGINDLAYINSNLPTSKVVNASKSTNELTLEVWIRPALKIQQDGARVITLSQDKDNSNFSILQNSQYFDFRVRTTTTTNRGEPGLSTAVGTATEELIHLVCTRAADGSAKIYKNGIEVSAGTIMGNFSNWNTNYRLQLGNEFQDPRIWLGTYYLVSVYDRALSQPEVVGNYNVGIIVDKKPEIIIEPNDLGLLAGQTAAFSVNAVGDTILSYQWYKNGVLITGATDSIYSIPAVSLSDNGNLFFCIVTNNFGNDISRFARLHVTALSSRVSSGNTVLYNFHDGIGDTIKDVSGFGTPLNLIINSPSSVEWRPYGLVVDSISDIQSIEDATKLYEEAIATNEFTFESWIKPENLTQLGAAIFSISANATDRRNFKLSQEATILKSWCRVSTSSVLGFELNTPYNSLTNNLVHLVFIRNRKERSQIFINGVEKAIAFPLGLDLSNWRPDYTLKLANEVISSQPWKGLYNLISMYNRALSLTEVQHNFTIGPIGNISIQPPDSLLALANVPSQIDISWRDKSSTEDGFIVERKKAGSAYSVIVSLPANSISYNDTTVFDTTTYYYRVKGFNILTESIYSNETSASTLLSTLSSPSDLTSIHNPADSTIVHLSWKDNSPNESGFIIERKQGDSLSIDLYLVLDSVSTDIINYQDTTVADTTMYSYRIKAYNQFTESGYSNQSQIFTPIPVELASFSAKILNGTVVITWETTTELNNQGFLLQRSRNQVDYIDLVFVKGQGSSSVKTIYTHVDKTALSGKYHYRLKQLDFNGSEELSKSTEVDLGLPKSFSLEQNYPNPFNPSTNIRFALAVQSWVSLKLFNALGQEVTNILNTDLDAGVHEITFNAVSFSSGVYFYMIRSQGIDGSISSSTKRMILIK